MKKTLALVLALAMVFSTFTVAFAEDTISADAQTCANLGMLKGETGTVDAAYTATAPTRLQAVVMLLRLRGLEAEALAFTGEANFADGNIAWAEGSNLLAYLKANPQLGWQGDGTNFNPAAPITAQEYYKALLEALGYKQSTAEVVGDFAYADTMTFAASKGLSLVATVTNYTVNDLAIATVEALKATMKDGGKTLAATLVEAGKMDKAAAIAAKLYADDAAVTAALDTVTAIGNTVVEVVFDADVDAAAAGNVANYAIEGLAINAAVVAGTDTVRLETAAMTAGKLYTLTAAGSSVKFTGVAKVSGAPAIETVLSEDIEEVVINFTKNIDFATGADVANYAIEGVEIAKAEVSADEVTLTTVGLASRKQYTVKVTNVKSIDGNLLKSASKSFYTRPNTSVPKLSTVVAETNQRLVLTFDQTITEESAENIANYTIKTVVGDTQLAVLSAVLKTSGTGKNTIVTLTTEVQTANKKYEISVLGIADRTKAANTIKTADKETFYGKKEDTTDPVFASAKVISRDLVKVTFTDSSMLDEASILDVNNYTLKKGSTEYTVESIEKVSSTNGEYVALLTVEAMGVGSYSLEADAILDEFDNEMSATKEYFTVDKDSFASAAVSSVTITGENEITVIFDKELKEASAEDISFYSVNKEIGNALEATYTDDEVAGNPVYKVVLETNDLLDNVGYKLTVNGVEDLAANVLNYTSPVSVKNAASIGWDVDAPELEDAYSINKNVVALAFDEAVAYSDVTTLTLANKANLADRVTLVANALASDDTVIEFSNTATGLTNNVTYTVYSLVYGAVTGVTDVALNAFAPADYANFEVYGTDEDPENVEVVSITQTNGKTFELTMSKIVTGAATVTSTGSVATFDVTYDDDVVTLVKQGDKIAENAEYKINLSALLSDEHGIAVVDDGEETPGAGTTTFYAEYKDDDKPYIVNVVATSRTTVEVEYSEEIKGANGTGTYSIVNADEDVSTVDIAGTATIDADDATIVEITLTAPLQAIYDYELTMKTGANVDDIAGNDVEESTTDIFSFNGTDLAQ